MPDRHARRRRPPADPRRRPVDGYRATSRARFRRLVEEAVASLPGGLRTLAGDVRLRLLDVPPADGAPPPLVEVTSAPVAADVSSRPVTVVTVHRRPVEARAHDRGELTELLRHELLERLAVHLGLDPTTWDDLRP
jgi:predicted Zn-dependent protease with MMP-like domain